MRLIIATLALAFTAGLAHAEATCEAKAAEKKLAGAAKASFIKKCEKDAPKGAFATAAAEKKLAGAAKNSFLKKCEKDGGPAAAAASK